MQEKKAVVLLSGGLDSATILAIAKADGFGVHALSFDYGQRHKIELDQSRMVAKALGAVDYKLGRVDLTIFGGSALTSDTPVPKGGAKEGIPVTYVPARNTVFLSLALAYAETLGTGEIFIGVNALDYSGYPDCRPEYILAFEKMANLATKGAVEGDMPVTIHTPLLHMTKGEIILKGVDLGVDYSITLSCYDPNVDGTHCGECDSCLLRAKGFADAGMEDPAF